MPSEAEFTDAIKKEYGRDPTAKELEEFRQASAVGDAPDDIMPSEKEIREAFKEETGREPTA